MDNKVNYTLVGIFVVLLSAAFIVLFFWLSGTKNGQLYNTYLTFLNEDVTGLSLQSPVRFNGVQVGYVSSIVLDPKNPQLVKITLKVKEGTPISTSTVATLLPMGITGVVYVGLTAETPDAPLLKVRAGQVDPIIPSRPSFLMQLGDVLPGLANNLKEISRDFSKLLNVDNRQAINASLQHISTITQNLAHSSQKLDRITDNLDLTLRNTSVASKRFPEVMAEFQATMKNIRQTSIKVNGLSHDAKSVLQEGGVMLNNLNSQLLPATQQMLTKLNTMVVNLVGISTQLKRNPSMFIRGKQPALPGPGEMR